MVFATMQDRFLALMLENPDSWPEWVCDFRTATSEERKQGAHVVAVLNDTTMPIHIADRCGGIDDFNHLYPENRMFVLLIQDKDSDEKILSKTSMFMKREYDVYRSRYI